MNFKNINNERENAKKGENLVVQGYQTYFQMNLYGFLALVMLLVHLNLIDLLLIVVFVLVKQSKEKQLKLEKTKS